MNQGKPIVGYRESFSGGLPCRIRFGGRAVARRLCRAARDREIGGAESGGYDLGEGPRPLDFARRPQGPGLARAAGQGKSGCRIGAGNRGHIRSRTYSTSISARSANTSLRSPRRFPICPTNSSEPKLTSRRTSETAEGPRSCCTSPCSWPWALASSGCFARRRRGSARGSTPTHWRPCTTGSGSSPRVSPLHSACWWPSPLAASAPSSRSIGRRSFARCSLAISSPFSSCGSRSSSAISCWRRITSISASFRWTPWPRVSGAVD